MTIQVNPTLTVATLFQDVRGQGCEPVIGDWPDLVEKIRSEPPAPSKSACRLLKLATFGTKPRPSGSYRYDDNVLKVTGIEGDYDQGVISPDEAVELLEKFHIRACVYTTPSHTEKKPRWRVLAPFSSPVEPSARLGYAEILNGVLGGALAPETATLSQCYYFGPIDGAEYHVLSTFDDDNEGFCLDELAPGDAVSIPFETTAQTEQPDLGTDPAVIALEARGMVMGAKEGGAYFIKCPWESEHTTQGNGTDVVFYPPHTGGFQGYGFKCQHSHCASRTGKDVLNWLGFSAKGGEKEFEEEDIPLPMWPELPDEALYGVVGDFVRLASRDSEADPAAILLTALTGIGAMLGNAQYVVVQETRHPPRLYSTLVGNSSRARKGTSSGPVLRLLKRVDELTGGFQSLAITHGPMSSGEGLIYAVRDESDVQDKDGNPTDPGVDDKRLFVLEGEYAAVLKAMERDGNTLSTALRTAWDHGNLSPLTKHSRTKATGAHICATGHITAVELKILLSHSDVWNGSANRVLWGCVRRQGFVPFPQPIPDKPFEAIAGRVSKAVAVTSMKGTAAVPLSQQAVDLWNALYPMLARDIPGVLGVVTARAEAQTIRLALIYSLLDKSPEIGPEHIRAAIGTWVYCLRSAAYIFGEAEDDPRKTKILEALASGPKTQTEIRDIAFQRNKAAREIAEVLAEMEAANEITQQRKHGKGRPTTIWKISSTRLTRKTQKAQWRGLGDDILERVNYAKSPGMVV